jgi:lipopolysaccharide/colanic/teichoic acid biosynthesis glycosyltransferase
VKYYNCSKRIFDVAAATAMLILLLPILLLLSLLVRIFIGSPVLFTQLRPGLNENIFKLYKFRTMRDSRDAAGCLLSDAQRMTKFGKLLRSLSLDELPELIKVIKGDMSLVGPRPLLVEYLPYYTTEQRIRHTIRPGISGWAQINGRNALSWKRKFELDIWYVNNASLLLDIKILCITVFKIFKREGISAAGHATMTRFDLEAKSHSSHEIIKG